jgi:soluble lytic murein transglycosylase-like protein
VFALGVFALAGLVVSAFALTRGPDITKVAEGLGWPVSYVGAAREWSTWYRVPLEWVLATIIVESGGKPNVRGDADGRSLGLMQVNSLAHAAELAQAGVSPSQLLDPSTNIQWGTKYLKQFKDEVEAALGGRTPPIPLSWIVRLYYKGPATVTSVLKRGGNPATIVWASDALRRWAAAMAKVSALTGQQVA